MLPMPSQEQRTNDAIQVQERCNKQIPKRKQKGSQQNACDIDIQLNPRTGRSPPSHSSSSSDSSTAPSPPLPGSVPRPMKHGAHDDTSSAPYSCSCPSRSPVPCSQDSAVVLHVVGRRPSDVEKNPLMSLPHPQPCTRAASAWGVRGARSVLGVGGVFVGVGLGSVRRRRFVW